MFVFNVYSIKFTHARLKILNECEVIQLCANKEFVIKSMKTYRTNRMKKLLI